MTDPIADMLTRIRNGLKVNKSEIVLPMSKIKKEIADILQKNNWIEKVEVVSGVFDKKKKISNNFSQLKLILKYKKNNQPAIKSLKRISKPGLRVYVKKDEIPVVLNGLGMAIISTSAGLMTDREAREKNIGGELVCEIY